VETRTGSTVTTCVLRCRRALTRQILDKMSPSFLAYLETLKCRHNAQFFHAEAEKLGIKVRDDIERGSPLNVGDVLTADHPVIRTNPVTGWKALFVNRGFSDRILDVTKDESDFIYDYVNKIGTSNPECRGRY